MTNNKWIPVTESLPKHGVRVLVVCNNPKNHRDMHVGIAECYRWAGCEPRWSRKYHVTHWMPLPDMPDI